MAAVHLLAIERRAPSVAIFAPTLGGVAPSRSTSPDKAIPEFHDAVIEAIACNAEMMETAITEVPQTNEVGRSRLLRIALSMIGGDVRLFEFGASAGLNLRADHLPGDPWLESGSMPKVIERQGCDLNPIDPTTTSGRARLTSYVWMDDIDHFERLRGALQVAAEIPASVVRQDAADFGSALELREGSTTVLWHSSMWGCLPESTRRCIVLGGLRDSPPPPPSTAPCGMSRGSRLRAIATVTNSSFRCGTGPRVQAWPGPLRPAQRTADRSRWWTSTIPAAVNRRLGR